MKPPFLLSVFARLAAVAMLALSSMSCAVSLIDPAQLFPAAPVPATETPAPLAQTTFNLSLLAPLNPGETVALGILDEVTGLGLNPTLYAMTATDVLHYSIALPLPLNSTTKYRYYRQGGVQPANEDTALDKTVRYRLYTATNPAELNDILASWSDRAFEGGPLGRIAGTVSDSTTGQPLTNILVVAGGEATLTDSLGQYVLESLPQGTQTVSAYALDGTYKPFQQGADVRDQLTTTAPIQLSPAPLVKVTFTVDAPNYTTPGAPLRLAGNLIQLGNTFADLDGGISAVASRMPTLTAHPNNQFQYSITLDLPVGAYIRYKYTLGDGFWNAEHNADGTFVQRQLIVPANPTLQHDTIYSWLAGKSGPILFDVTVPANTPPGDAVYIQFNPYGWTEPIPMWPLGKNKWVYKLFGPLNMLGSFHYRFCRNGQCGVADDIDTASIPTVGHTISTSITEQIIQDTVNGWAWWHDTDPATVVAIPVNQRSSSFWAGVELNNSYRPNAQALYPYAMQSIKTFGANTLVLTPTWTATSINPLTFAPLPGTDPLMADALQMVQYGNAQSLHVAIYASPRLLPSTPDFWLQAARTPEWWNTWFDRYRAFVIYHADLAARAGSQALIIGGEAVAPALPGGLLINGSPSNAPQDAEARWRNLINETRQHFNGQLLWAQPYGNTLQPVPVFMDRFDAFYLLWSAPLSVDYASGVDVYFNEAARRLDTDILPMAQAVKKPVVIAIDYPSAQGAATGCVASNGGCLDWSTLSRPYPDLPSIGIDLQGQADLYQAMLQATNQRDWVGGFISRGYYPAAALIDKSSSIRNKTTADLLWYWFPRLTGAAQ